MLISGNALEKVPKKWGLSLCNLMQNLLKVISREILRDNSEFILRFFGHDYFLVEGFYYSFPLPATRKHRDTDQTIILLLSPLQVNTGEI